MSIATEITRLNNAKASIKSAIEAKGVTVPSSTKLDGYASLVSSIPGIVPTGTINITENGENIDVKQYATANVNVTGKEAENADWVISSGTESLYNEYGDIISFGIISVKNSFGDIIYNTSVLMSPPESGILSTVVDETFGVWILLIPVGGTLWNDLTKFTVENIEDQSTVEIKQIEWAGESIRQTPYGVAIRVIPTENKAFLRIKYNNKNIAYIPDFTAI